MQHDPDDETTSLAELAPGAVRRERELPGTTEDAWALLRDADGLERWLADEVRLEIAPGERGHLRDGKEVRQVEVESVEPGRRLSLRWWTSADDDAVVDLVLDEHDGRTRLTVVEIPLRLVAAPDTVPTSWAPPATGRANGPEAVALACR